MKMCVHIMVSNERSDCKNVRNQRQDVHHRRYNRDNQIQACLRNNWLSLEDHPFCIIIKLLMVLWSLLLVKSHPGGLYWTVNRETAELVLIYLLFLKKAYYKQLINRDNQNWLLVYVKSTSRQKNIMTCKPTPENPGGNTDMWCTEKQRSLEDHHAEL